MGRTFKGEDRERHRQKKPRRTRGRYGLRSNTSGIDPEPMQALEDNDSPDGWQNLYDLPYNLSSDGEE